MNSIDFNQPYKRKTFLDFLQHTFLPEDFTPSDEEMAFKRQFIDGVTHLGKCPDLGLNVYEIRHDKEKDPRVFLTRETFRLMQEYYDFNALAVFISSNSENYRFSYITVGLKAEGTKVVYEQSNPRRYSYFLGPDAKINTPTRFLVNEGQVKTMADLQKRFSVEVVNKEFYREIATLFTELVGGKRIEGSKTKEFGGILRLPSVTDHQKMQEFAVRMIGRIVFCWFLKKKTTSGGNPLIPESILSLAAVKGNQNYYHTILEKLFFQVLNTPKTPQNQRRDEFKSGPFSDIPFLNGGLFEPHIDDIYELNEFSGTSNFDNTLVVPDEWLDKLLELLERYNFTIDENTSMDVELSVDPEMLGRIFENLLAEINPETGETARKSTGSYYTPRPIVEYMVDESLKQYLLTKTGIEEGKLQRLLSFSEDVERLSGEERRKIIDALDTVKIIDPACGSGAFPMSILQKMVWVLRNADPELEIWKNKQLEGISSSYVRGAVEERMKSEDWNYIRKMDIIQNAIYGVDIQQIAVEISKLRVFLSLVVDSRINDSQSNRGIKPLPNLEFKFVCSNSLVGLPKEDQTGNLFDANTEIKKLKMLRDRYFSSFGNEKHQIEEEFKNTQHRMFRYSIDMGAIGKKTVSLSEWDPFSDKASNWFDSDWMFGIKGGFDIVIANPPYIRADNKNPDYIGFRRKLEESGEYKTLFEKWDLIVPFIEKGLSIMRNDGNLIYIVSNSICTTKYSSRLLEFIQKDFFVSSINYFEEMKIFDAAVNPVVMNINKNDFDWPVKKIIRRKYFENIKCINRLSTTEFRKLGKDGFRKELNHIEIAVPHIMLSDICYISVGMVLNANEKISKGDFTAKDLISDEQTETNIKKYIEAKDIENYKIKRVRFLEWGTDRCPAKIRRKTFEEMYEKPKLMVGSITGGIYDDDGLYTHHGIINFVRFIDLRGVDNKSIRKNIKTYNSLRRDQLEDLSNEYDLKYLLSIINSNFSKGFLNNIRRHQMKNYFYPDDFRKLPIARIDMEKQGAFVEIVDKIMDITNEVDYQVDEKKQKQVAEYKREIDQLVYQLYDLTSEEIAIVEGEK